MSQYPSDSLRDQYMVVSSEHYLLTILVGYILGANLLLYLTRIPVRFVVRLYPYSGVVRRTKL